MNLKPLKAFDGQTVAGIKLNTRQIQRACERGALKYSKPLHDRLTCEEWLTAWLSEPVKVKHSEYVPQVRRVGRPPKLYA